MFTYLYLCNEQIPVVRDQLVDILVRTPAFNQPHSQGLFPGFEKKICDLPYLIYDLKEYLLLKSLGTRLAFN